LPDRRELKEMASSGADVPKATIVRPITDAGIFKFLAKDEAPSTKKSAHFIRIKNPATDSKIFNGKLTDPRFMADYVFMKASAGTRRPADFHTNARRAPPQRRGTVIPRKPSGFRKYRKNARRQGK
jgi:hypothetical protein